MLCLLDSTSAEGKRQGTDNKEAAELSIGKKQNPARLSFSAFFVGNSCCLTALSQFICFTGSLSRETVPLPALNRTHPPFYNSNFDQLTINHFRCSAPLRFSFLLVAAKLVSVENLFCFSSSFSFAFWFIGPGRSRGLVAPVRLWPGSEFVPFPSVTVPERCRCWLPEPKPPLLVWPVLCQLL